MKPLGLGFFVCKARKSSANAFLPGGVPRLRNCPVSELRAFRIQVLRGYRDLMVRCYRALMCWATLSLGQAACRERERERGL